MQPKVSVIVPIYKVEKYLDRCIRSLFAQTMKEIEIILVDDGSPDRCPEMCDEYARQDPRIRVVHKKNGGLGFARNSGLEIAAGEYITFLDSDDYVAADMCEKMYAAAKENDADLVLAGMNIVGGVVMDEQDAVERKHCFREKELFIGAEGRKKLAQGFVGAMPGEPEDSRYSYSACKNFYRGDMIRQNEIRFRSEREVVCEDIVFQLEMVPFVEHAVGIPGAYLYYCRNGDSLSKGYREDRFDRCMLSVQKIKEHMPKSIPLAEYRIYLDRQIQAQARVVSIQEIQHAKECGMSARELNARLQRINTSPELSEVLRRYPWYRLPPAQAAFAFAMRFHLPALERLFVELKAKR